MRLDSLPGSVLDHKYRIDQQLGRGATGAVFQATHIGTMRTVALKVIVPKLAAQAEFSQRFKREAEAAGRLRHPNVVNMTDFGVTHVENDDLAYMVMEYLDGQTLSAHLKSDPRPSLNFILDVVDQAALALDAAHQAGTWKGEEMAEIPPNRIDLPQGMLDLLILKTVALGVHHGCATS